MTPIPTLLMTRPRPASDRFVAALPPALRRRIAVCHNPLIEIVPRDGALDLGPARGLIFTSANGVAAAAAATDRRDLPCFCVGAATTRAARAAGWEATDCGPTGDALVTRLMADLPKAPLLHLSGAHRSGDIAGRLSAAGCATAVHVLYDQELRPLGAAARAILERGGPAIVALFSPRTARQFAAEAAGLGGYRVAALSAAVAEPLENRPETPVFIAERPDADAMAALVEKLANRICRVEGGGAAQ